MAKPKKAGMASKSGTDAQSDLDMLRELVALLESSSAATIKLQRGDATYEVSRAGTPAATHNPVVLPAPVPSLPSAPSVPTVPSVSTVPTGLIDIKSPMVGTFYKSPEPGAEPYVKVGTRISVGQTLCIIEAMKIMNELEAEVGGVIREILVEDAQPVEFGQVLFRVDPNG